MTTMIQRRLRQQAGFTLIELMITVAIVAILASIAYPSYREQVAKGHRGEARAILLAGQQWMERFYSENFRYDQNSAGNSVTDPFKQRFSTSPAPGDGKAMYDVALTADLTRNTYKIKATRKAATAMANDRCGNLTIDHLGRKSVEDYKGFTTAKDAVQDCWR